jgi:hypothetical protein
VLLVGSKLTAAKEIVQVTERRKELKANIAILQLKIELEEKLTWIDDATHDAAQREARIGEMLAAPMSSSMENEAIQRCLRLRAMFESSSAGATQLPRSATITRQETKHDAATNLSLGCITAEIRASVLEIVAYILNDDSRYFKSLYAAAPNFVRAQVLETPSAHHTITFVRFKAPGISDRTFLNSIAAKKVAEDPLTYAVALVPIPSHAKIGPMDEIGAVRAELYRSFRLTEVVPGVTKLEYASSLDLKGWVPQIVSQTIAGPEQRV